MNGRNQTLDQFPKAERMVSGQRAGVARRLIVVASLLALSGCWASGQLRYRDHPELAKVKVATGEEKGLPKGELGVVTAKAEGYSTCDQLIAEALSELLAEARSLGGSGVQQVKFRRRWYWSGRDPVCRRSLLGSKSVEARGVAVK